MNEIMMNQKVAKWNEACRFLKGKQSDLSVEEWTAIELLADFWRERSFDEDTVAECEELVATLSSCDKLHIANLDIITWSKEFRGIAKMMYTKDKETFEQFRAAMKQFNRANRPQPSRPAPEGRSSASLPTRSPVNNILLKQHLQKWHKAASYLLGVWGELSQDEQNAVQVLVQVWKTDWLEKNNIERCVNILAASDKLHTANKDIIVQSKELRGICRQYVSKGQETFAIFKKALADYVASNPLPPRRPAAAPFSPSVRITRIEFGNCDQQGNMISGYGQSLYTDTVYLKPRITCQVLKSGNSKTDIWYKIFDPSGQLMVGQQAREGYTWHGVVGLSASGTTVLGGFGSPEGRTYTTPGTWTIEFYEDDHLLCSTRFVINQGTTPVPPRQGPHTPPPPPPPPPPHKKHGCLWFLVIAGVLAAAYNFLFQDDDSGKPEQLHHYVYAEKLFLRSTPVAENDKNLVATIPYGSEVLVHSDQNGWANVTISGQTGYVASNYLLDAADFRLLNAVWSSDAAREQVSTSRYRLAMLHYLKSNQLTSGSQGWQFFPPASSGNTLAYPKLDDAYGYFSEFAFILKDNATGSRKAVVYAFLEDEKPVFCHAQDAPASGGIRSVSYKGRENKYVVNFTSGRTAPAPAPVVEEQAPVAADKPAAASGFTVRKVEFGNVDYNNNILTRYGSQLYTDIQYLRPLVYFTRTTSATEDIEFGVKIFTPSGDLIRGRTSPVGYTFLYKVKLSRAEGFFDMMGWGTKDGNFYKAGNYRYEIWRDGQKLHTSTVSVKQKTAAAEAAPDNEVYNVVDQMPEFPNGGSAGLARYLGSNIKYPKEAMENGTQGTVRVQFVVQPDGSLTDVKVVGSVAPSLDKEAVRVIQSMPRWKPGTMKGKAVRVRYTIPVKFQLS